MYTHTHTHTHPFPHTVVEPTITMQPADVLGVSLNQMVSFAVVASGDTPSYQWFMVTNVAVLIQGATQSTYTIVSVDEQDEGRYFCQVSNAAGSVNSTAAVLMLCKFVILKERERETILFFVPLNKALCCVRVCGFWMSLLVM